MALVVDTPDPPTLDDPRDPGEYEALDDPDEWTGDDHRREEIATLLQEGAWDDAFVEWSEHTILTEDEFDVVVELGLIDELDFYWNQAAEDVGYRAPFLPATLPDHLRDRLEEPDAIETELDDLGRTTSEALENDYIHRDARQFGFFQDR